MKKLTNYQLELLASMIQEKLETKLNPTSEFIEETCERIIAQDKFLQQKKQQFEKNKELIDKLDKSNETILENLYKKYTGGVKKYYYNKDVKDIIDTIKSQQKEKMTVKIDRKKIELFLLQKSIVNKDFDIETIVEELSKTFKKK